MELTRQIEAVKSFVYHPLISIITPVYNPVPEVLRAAIDSVLSQTYPDWELCIADGGSDMPAIREVLWEYARRDSRIRPVLLDRNLGISGNSNAALQSVQGEFIALLDHDDILAPFALFEVAQELNQNPELDLIYSDYDLLTNDGAHRYQPLFKPDWSPEIMLSASYITHLTVIRTKMVSRVGGFDPQVNGAQDWDLFLRVSEQTHKVAHIPKILYHWRTAGNSTAEDIWAKPYAPMAQVSVITGHLARLGLNEPKTFFDESGYLRVNWAYNRQQKVSIIIPSRGAGKLLEVCIHSLLHLTLYSNFEIIVVNNGPRRPELIPYYRKISTDRRVRVVHFDAPFNYSAANNYGATIAQGDLLLFLNNDTRVIVPDWLDELVMWAQRQEVGAVGGKLLRPNGKIQHAGIILGLTGLAGHIFGGQPENRWSLFGLAEWYRDYLAVTAACLMIRREVFERIGRFNEQLGLCGNDVELCLRLLKAGLRVVYNPYARLIHIESATRRSEIPLEDYRNSFDYYLPFLQSGDPFFNPNLSYWRLSPTLAQPDEPASLEFVQKLIHAQQG
jgi:GT2 family glycosyltransferase